MRYGRKPWAAGCVAVFGLFVAANGFAGAPAVAKPSPPTPRLPDGTVDLGGTGIWQQPWITDFARQIIDGPVGEVPYLPWTKAMVAYNQGNKVAYDPQGFCLPPGGPRMFGTPFPSQFLQQPHRIIVIFEGGAHVWREIFTDGRPHPPKEEWTPTYFGHATGRWEGDTLVIDTVGFNERTWIDFGGRMHTDELHTIERISRPDRNTLRYEATIDDPGAYTRPWTVAWTIPWTEGADLNEYICQDNNQFMIDLKDEFGVPFFQSTKSE